MNEQQMMQYYQQMNPGVDVNSPEFQQGFSQFMSTMAGQQGQGGATPVSQMNVGNSLSGLLGVNPSTAGGALNLGASKASTGGNTSEVQGSAQTGQYTSNGQTTTGVNDTLGLGALVQNLIGSTPATQANETTALNQIMKSGNPYMQQQTTQAVNNALSGPGMQGTGNNAQGRAAGNAAAQVAQNSVGNQLSAAQLLNSGSATGAAVNAGVPLENTTQTQSQGGTAQGTNLGIAQGQVPTSSTSSGSGCFACTAYVDLGWISRRLVLKAVQSKLARKSQYEKSLMAYAVYGPVLARLVLHSRLFARLFFPVCRAVLYEEIRLSHPTLPVSRVAKFYHWCFSALRLPTKRRQTRDAETVALLNRHNLNFGEW